MINFYSSEKSNINFIYFYIIIMSSYYNNKIQTDPEFYDKEKKRVVAYIKNRYNTDEEYREKRKEYCRLKMKEINARRKEQVI